jgi:hypothetical protein
MELRDQGGQQASSGTGMGIRDPESPVFLLTHWIYTSCTTYLTPTSRDQAEEQWE